MASRGIIAVMFASTLLVGGSAVAEQPKSTAQSTSSTTLRGCVVESMGHYVLNNPTVLDPKATPPHSSAVPSSLKTADVQPYELIGGQAKAHVGHQVEIVGTMRSDHEAVATRGSEEPAPTAHPMAGRIVIKSLRMLATTCP